MKNFLFKTEPLHNKILNEALDERVLFFNPQAPEIAPEDSEDGQKSKARYGLYSEDINGFYSPNFKEYCESLVSQYKDGVELYQDFINAPKTTLDKVLNKFSVVLSYIKALNFIDFSLTQEYWVWVVDSLDTIRYDIVDETYRRKTKVFQKDVYEEKAKNITREQMLDYVCKNYEQVSERMWVSTTDPTVIVYDNLAKPYKLRDGWSVDQIGEILSEWLEMMSGKEIAAEHLKSDS